MRDNTANVPVATVSQWRKSNEVCYACTCVGKVLRLPSLKRKAQASYKRQVDSEKRECEAVLIADKEAVTGVKKVSIAALNK